MIYLDIGCHNGQTIRDFFAGKFGIQPEQVSHVIGIDPLNRYAGEWDKLHNAFPVHFVNAAAFDKEGTINFSVMPDDISSSVMEDKQRYNKGEIIRVRCFDLSSFIRDLNHDVVIRMDIEGAEYPVLQKLIDDGTIDRVKYLEIEWHSQKMKGDWPKAEQKLLKWFRVHSFNFKEIK